MTEPAPKITLPAESILSLAVLLRELDEFLRNSRPAADALTAFLNLNAPSGDCSSAWK
ncbi:MAG: hypothetical protein ACRDN9_20180 [Streptosporangiaceae bacterium]